MKQLRGDASTLVRELIVRLSEPLIAVPTADWAAAAIRGLSDCSTEDGHVRLLSGAEIDQLAWALRAEAADAVSDGTLSVRTGPVTEVVIAGTNNVATVDRTPTPPCAYLGELEDDHRGNSLQSRWDDAETVDLGSGQRELLQTVSDEVGEVAAEITSDAITATRRSEREVDPAAAAIWASAVVGTRLDTIVDAIAASGVASKRTAYRRSKMLRREGFIKTVPVSDDGHGRPLQIETAVPLSEEDPIPQTVRDALLQ
jgi:hypothetical protein